MPDKLPPLSPTVSSIFETFLKKLEAGNTVGAESIEDLRKAFEEQKLDPESLRKALFTSSQSAQ